MNRNSLRILSLVATLASLSSAFAAEDADLVEKVAVRNRLFTVNGKWEVGANVGLSLLSKLTDHYNLNVSVAKNLNEVFAIELRAGYAISKHTSLADQIETDFFKNTLKQKSTLDDAADLWQMSANAIVGARFQPIYGKVNLMAEVPLHFQFYVWAGAGFGLFTRSSLALCANKPDANSCRVLDAAAGTYDVVKETKPGPIGSVAVGFRFFVPGQPNHAIKVEVRDWAFLDSYYVGVKRDQQTTENPRAGGQPNPNAGLTNLVQVDLGYSFIF